MDYLPDWTLRSQRPVMELEFDLKAHGRQMVTFEIVTLRYGDFRTVVAASTKEGNNKTLLGWVGFYEGHK